MAYVSSAAAAIVALQGLALAITAVYYGYATLTGTPGSLSGAAVTGGLALAAAVGLFWVAHGLAGDRRWSRAPTIVAQILVLTVGLPLTVTERWYVALPLVASGVAVLLLVLVSAGAAED